MRFHKDMYEYIYIYAHDQPPKSTLVFTDDAPQKCIETCLSLPLLPNQMSSCILTRGIHIPLTYLSLRLWSERIPDGLFKGQEITPLELGTHSFKIRSLRGK